jgi:hypothetical protein
LLTPHISGVVYAKKCNIQRDEHVSKLQKIAIARPDYYLFRTQQGRAEKIGVTCRCKNENEWKNDERQAGSNSFRLIQGTYIVHV